eukprot:CAMPEP_0194520598 /NCGR_PEP_ID=MMETSP0253-20130528/54637_1 /TAXON_ID=2966 /ORGANISM="Noctiluca scintillans" /LENGTH=42 /DNA_ID= /DNA_START= /DNA_END= /DNA_ORIENTATION=
MTTKSKSSPPCAASGLLETMAKAGFNVGDSVLARSVHGLWLS